MRRVIEILIRIIVSQLEEGFAKINHKLDHINERLSHMNKQISDFVTATTEAFDKVDAAVAGLTQDVKTLNDMIAALQNSPGTLTPEDQAALDGIQTRAVALAAKVSDLDNVTPPPPPTV